MAMDSYELTTNITADDKRLLEGLARSLGVSEAEALRWALAVADYVQGVMLSSRELLVRESDGSLRRVSLGRPSASTKQAR